MSLSKKTNGSPTILVVDDDPFIVKAIKMILENRGEYNVLVARSGLECLQRVGETLPDLILLDILMPGLDGVQVLKKLRHNPTFENVPVLMVSVDAQLEQMATCFECGANGFLIKPFDASDLYRQVRNAVARGTAVRLQHHLTH